MTTASDAIAERIADQTRRRAACYDLILAALTEARDVADELLKNHGIDVDVDGDLEDVLAGWQFANDREIEDEPDPIGGADCCGLGRDD